MELITIDPRVKITDKNRVRLDEISALLHTSIADHDWDKRYRAMCDLREHVAWLLAVVKFPDLLMRDEEA